MRILLLSLIISSAIYCKTNQKKGDTVSPDAVTLVILGTAQDGGAPHIGCKKQCCAALFDHPERRINVVSLGIIDPQNRKKFIFECTPDFPVQAKLLHRLSPFDNPEMPDGIFLTHAHIGHYAGLMYLGKEATNADTVPVYAMPRMQTFLENNGPWSQLVNYKNISIKPLSGIQSVRISSNLTITPVQVPHRDEFSETVGYIIAGPNKKVLFIPDIDKWSKWERDIVQLVEEVDYAFLDGTFYNAAEINNRDISAIPHPLIIESMELFRNLPPSTKDKIHFIHFNHTNPVLDAESEASKQVKENGFHVARLGEILAL